MLGSAVSKDFADLFRLAGSYEDDIKVMTRLVHQILKLLGTDHVTSTIRVLEHEEVLFQFCFLLVIVQPHRLLVSVCSVARDVEHSGPLPHDRLKVFLRRNLALEGHTLPRILQGLLNHLCFFCIVKLDQLMVSLFIVFIVV